jgi:hypothetical protein
MLAATAIAIFIIPLLFVLVERLRGAGKRQVEEREQDQVVGLHGDATQHS